MAQAALKFRRAKGWAGNASPMTDDEAHTRNLREKLAEELADVLVCVDALDGDQNCRLIRTIKEKKAKRWHNRMAAFVGSKA